jgi:hypothetical protein
MRFLPLLVAAVSLLDWALFGVPEGWGVALTGLEIAALVSAVSSVAGGAASLFGGDGGGVQIKNTPGVAFDPSGDPLLGALQQDALIQLGQFSGAAGNQSRPLQTVINETATGAAGDLRRQDLTFLNVALSRIQNAVDGTIATGGSVADATRAAQAEFDGLPVQFSNPLVQAITAAGTNLSALVIDDFNFQKRAKEQAPAQQAASDAAAAGRLDAIRSISQLHSDFPLATEENLAQFEAAEKARQALQFDRAREQLLETANIGGFNPGAGIAELNRDQAAADLDAIIRAITIQGGRQGLAEQGIGALQGSLNPAGAQGTAGLGLGASTSAAQLAANQALALAQIQAGQPAQSTFGGDTLAGLSNSLGTIGLLAALGQGGGLFGLGNAKEGPAGKRTNTNPNTNPGLF